MRLLLLGIASLLALAGCHGKADPPGEAPANVTAEPGDGLVLLKWDTLPDLTYWIFFQPGGDVTAAAPGTIAIRRAISPRAVGNLLNGTRYAFVMNATRDGSAAGPSSPVVLATPRLAGDTWVSGTALGAPPQNLNSIVFSGSRFVVVGDAAGNAPTIFAGDYNYTSAAPDPPGVTAWMPPTSVPAGFAANLSSIIFNGTFVALGANGSIVSSADGLTWASNGQVPATGITMNGIAFGFASGVTPIYVAVGNGGKIFTSADLATWTPRDVSGITTGDLNSISLLNGSFFVTGAGGTLLASPDGVNWSLQNPGTTSTLRGVTFSATSAGIHYVAVGDAGTIATSPDAVTWTAMTLPGGQNLRSVTTGGASGSRFLAVGQGGAVVFSDDGVNWTAASAGSANLAKAVSAPALYLAVGEAGANTVSK